MGAAGDMLMAALLELHPQPVDFLCRLNGLGIPGVTVEREQAVKCGITGTHIAVRIGDAEEESVDIPAGDLHAHGEHAHTHDHGAHTHDHGHCHDEHDHDHSHEHPHSHTHDHDHGGQGEIEALLASLPLSDRVRADVLAVYALIAQAESKAHGRPVDQVHFHEVGTMDAVADIVGVCLLMEELGPLRVVVSPVHVGSGQVRCAHGILPVPAPATAHILMGIPTYGGQIKGELCTPTGAALLRHFAGTFGDRPIMRTEAIGYGMGKKDFPVANCVRAFLGTEAGDDAGIVELACNLDDMTGEELGFALETLMDAGALDVYMVPIQMKKSRPGHLLACLCRPEDEERLAALMLKHTTTFGVRSHAWRRHILSRSFDMAETACGPVRVKTGRGYGVTKAKPEYEDLARLARTQGLTLYELKDRLCLKRTE